MTGEVIKSFLVGLGFDVDEGSLATFNQSIKSASLRVTALYASIQVAATGIFATVAKTSQSFEDMGYQLRLVAPAMNRWLVMREAMLTAYSKAGVNLTQTVQQAILFNYSLAKTKFALEAVYKSVAAKFFPVLTKQMDIFRNKIFANMPKIQSQLTKFVEAIFKAFAATVEIGTRLWSMLTRVYDFFERLHRATKGWSTVIFGVIAAWYALNLAFLATPFGQLIAGLTALLALYDDFKVWQEGGKSFFNWGSETALIIEGLVASVFALVAVIYTLKAAMLLYVGATKAWAAAQVVLNGVMALFTGELEAAAIAAAILEAPIWLVVVAVAALVAGLTAADAKWGIFGGKVSGFFSGVGGKVLELFGGGPKNLAMSGAMGPPPPLLPNQTSSQQNVQQQTSIVVNGAADAHQVGRHVASQQDRVNYDMTRNMKGAMQ